MIKKLDILIIKAFTWPFIATFFITLFVLLMQIIWKYIDDLVGKGLDFITIVKFVIFASATMVTLALPIAILLSSIMTFGKLGESYELVAIKSSGISLIRFMRPLFLISIILCFITFLFQNYIIPVATLKFEVLYSDIYKKSPAFDLKDGVFYNGLRGYSIKVGKKDKDRSTLHNVLIYESSNGVQDNAIMSERGIMKISPDKKFLEFKLINGDRYETKGDFVNTYNNEFTRLSFKEYNKLFDLAQLDMQNSSDSIFKKGSRMLTVRKLDKAIDSLSRYPDSLITKTGKDLKTFIGYYHYKDSLGTSSKKIDIKSFSQLIPDSLKSIVHQNSLQTASTINGILLFSGPEFKARSKDIRLHLIEWHRKFSLSFACLVLFFIGAPLGALIRKGGLGVPLLVAIAFFVIFHLLNTFGEKFVKENVMTPLLGMWLSILTLAPLGIFLIYKATIDSQLFNQEFYYRIFKNLSSFISPLIGIFKK